MTLTPQRSSKMPGLQPYDTSSRLARIQRCIMAWVSRIVVSGRRRMANPWVVGVVGSLVASGLIALATIFVSKLAP